MLLHQFFLHLEVGAKLGEPLKELLFNKCFFTALHCKKQSFVVYLRVPMALFGNLSDRETLI